MPGDFSTVKPIERNIQLVRELHASGHYIIISTSRLMLELNGNVGAVIAACGNQTMTSMAALHIPYDEIHFGQPNADLYIDRAVACASVDTEKDIGWRLKGGKGNSVDGMIAARHFNEVQLDGEYVIKTAATSVLRGEMFFYERVPADIADLFPRLVSSSAQREDQREGEASSRPAARAARAPPLPACKLDMSALSSALHSPKGSANGNGAAGTTGSDPAASDPVAAAPAAAAAFSPAAAAASVRHGGTPPALSGLVVPSSPRSAGNVSSMTLQRIHGVTFSHLVTSRCLTPGRLQMLLSALRRTHSSSGDAPSHIPPSEIDLGANYLPKIRTRCVHAARSRRGGSVSAAGLGRTRSACGPALPHPAPRPPPARRYETHVLLYASLCPTAPAMFERICVEMGQYVAEGRFRHARVIHGDPVFSNVLLTDAPAVVLLDMRGEVGNHLTLQGDMLYDLSKVYQSLLGRAILLLLNYYDCLNYYY